MSIAALIALLGLNHGRQLRVAREPVFEPDRAPVEPRQGERGAAWRAMNLEGSRSGRGPGAGQQREGQPGERDASDYEALTAFSTSSGSRRSSGLFRTFTNFTVPVLSMMKYARFAYR
jgi:hypothetical protein